MMTSNNRFGFLRRILRTLGLSRYAADNVVNWIVALLGGEDKSVTFGGKSPFLATDEGNSFTFDVESPEFPYLLRDHFLTPAELSFYSVLRSVIENRAALCMKVSLGDLFWVRKDDPSHYRIYTNKIDRKHVDFLLCDPATMCPVVGIELDDKSHERADRRSRDEFVDQVFAAAQLPLLHVPARRAYVATELAIQLAPYLGFSSEIPRTPIPNPLPPVSISFADVPHCPKCGGTMILRTAKSGANAGNQFWGCSTYPNCRAILPYVS